MRSVSTPQIRCAPVLRLCVNAGWLVAAVALLIIPCSGSAAAEIESAISAFNSRSFDDKATAAANLAKLDHPRVLEILNAFLGGKLYTDKTSPKVVIVHKVRDGGYTITDPLSGAELGTVGRRDVKRISINNDLRQMVRGLIAGLQLNQPKAEDRISAIESIVAAELQESRPLLVLPPAFL